MRAQKKKKKKKKDIWEIKEGYKLQVMALLCLVYEEEYFKVRRP